MRLHRAGLAIAALLGLIFAGLSGSSASAHGKEYTVDWIASEYTIPAATGPGHDGGGQIWNNLQMNKKPPCNDCDIIAIEPDLTDTSGNSLHMHHDGQMLHHMVLYEQGALDASCPGIIPAFGMKRIFASGDERTEIPPMPGYALHVGPNTQWAVLSDLMNFDAAPRTVQVRLKVTYTEGSTHKKVTPVWLDVTGCGFSYVDVPAGESHQTGYWFSSIKGDIIGIGGHVHEHGKWVKAVNVFKNEDICRSDATQEEYGDGMHGIVDMTICTGKPLAKINYWDLIKTESFYNGPHGVKGAMGIMIMYVHRT